MKVKSPFLVKPHSSVRLAHFASDVHPDCESADASLPVMARHRQQLDRLQEVFYASQQKALLIVLQGMDTAGKDGTIRHIFSGVNPQGCQVASFKVPTPLEQRHDFLWRCHQQVPPKGILGIFNRSHYEDVLSPRVHGAIDKKVVQARLDNINSWEKMLTDNGVVIVKFFLHISQKEQTARLQSRIDDPDKHWKLSPADFEERLYWSKYQAAYEEAISHTSPAHAPWFVIPSDHKWYRNLAISGILVDTLASLKLKFPPPAFDPSGIDLKKKSDVKVARKVLKRERKNHVEPERDFLVTGKSM